MIAEDGTFEVWVATEIDDEGGELILGVHDTPEGAGRTLYANGFSWSTAPPDGGGMGWCRKATDGRWVRADVTRWKVAR